MTAVPSLSLLCVTEANVNLPKADDGRTPLYIVCHSACAANEGASVQLAELLLQHGTPPLPHARVHA